MNLHPSTVSLVFRFGDELDQLLPSFDASGHAVRPQGPWRAIDPASDERDRELVLAAIARLPEPYQSIHRLHDGRGLSTDDIAHRLDMPRQEIASLLHQARCALITLLNPHLSESPEVAPRA